MVTRKDFDPDDTIAYSSSDVSSGDLKNSNLIYEVEQYNTEEEPLTRDKELPEIKEHEEDDFSTSLPRSKKLPPSPPSDLPLPPLPSGSSSTYKSDASPDPFDSSPDPFPYGDYEAIHGLQKYSVYYQGEELFIDSSDWRTSSLLKIQILTSFSVFILFGLAEQAVGALLPKLQDHYDINDLEVSFIFLCSVSGYVIMAILNEFTHKMLGIKGVAIMGCIFMTTCYLIVSFKPPYFILLLCYIGNGIGFGSLDAGLNGWMGYLADSNQLLGILHGCYGIGCMITPPLVTTMLERKKNPWPWNQYYVVLVVTGSVALLMMILSFRYETPLKYKYMLEMKNKRQTRGDDGELNNKRLARGEDIEMQDLGESVSTNEEDAEDTGSASFSDTLKYPLVWILSLILFIYVGGEVAFGSWLITFLLRIKKLSYKLSSYLATSFWSGLTVGRIGLGFVTAHYFKSELVANLVYIVCSFAGFMVFWLFAFADVTGLLFVIVFVTGAAVGPIFPTTIVTSLKILPVKYHTAGIGFICALGGGGAAAVPFLIGLIAESSDLGLRSFPLIVAVMFGVLMVMWIGVFNRYRGVYGNMF